MLILALICTVLGLALLIAALATGILPLAWACIGICALGFIFLIVDIVKHRSFSSKQGSDDTAGNADKEVLEDAEDTVTSADTAVVDSGIIED